MALPLVLDTDMGTDVDDALALAYALRHPEIDLRLVTTTAGDTVRRAEIAQRLVELAGRDDVEVAAGVGDPLEDTGRSGFMGHEGDGVLDPDEHPGISPRDGVAALVETCVVLAAGGAPRAEVCTIGGQTNVAVALDRVPAFPDTVRRMAVMGGVFRPIQVGGVTLPPSIDHNLQVDPAAAMRSLNTVVPKLYVPLDVTIGTYLTAEQNDRLRGGDALCRTLARMVDVWSVALHALAPEMPADHVSAMHDPLTVACMVDRTFVSVDAWPVTAAREHGVARTFVDPVAGRPAEVVSAVDAEAFAEHWLEVVLG